jgi:pimeloyl-ACP methyl ester carboxylesterase
MNKTTKRLLIGGAVFGGQAAVNSLIAALSRPPSPSLHGERRDFPWDWGRVSYTVKGSGRPLLLVHGVYPGASSFEWRSNFDALAQDYRVYAPDLLGFGLSDKPNAPYSAHLYTRLMEDFQRVVIGEPAFICASSLGSAFCVAAYKMVPLARKMALVCPTGITHLRDPESLGGRLIDGLFQTPVLGLSLYNAVASRKSIRRYLEAEVYADPARVTADLAQQYHAMAHQPGAQHAVRAFLSGRLNINIAYAFSDLDIPVLLLWGRRAQKTSLSDADAFIGRNPCALLRVFDHSGLLPHEEEASAFNASLREFLGAGAVQLAEAAGIHG